MGWRQYCRNNAFSLKGRLGRARYLGWTGSGMALWLFLMYFGAQVRLFWLPSPLSIALFLFMLPFCIRRLHDLNLSGWWILLCHPLVNFGAFLVLTMMPGSTSANRYGLVPLPPRRRLVALAIACLPLIAFVCTLSLIGTAMFLIMIYRSMTSCGCMA
jgi:uncharacterized membrane protein YhaH (DUF805 family)